MSENREPLVSDKRAEEAPVLRSAAPESFSGYGVLGVPFASGHYLALRHFTTSSIGPPYRAVWHRDPQGRWTVHSDASPELSCPRYLDSALDAASATPIGIEWTGPQSLTVQIPDLLRWRLEISRDLATWLMSGVGSLLPAGAESATWLLRAIGVVAGPLLSVGKVRLEGKVPNGQTFGAIPRRVWRIVTSSAELHGEDLGPPAPLPDQERLGDLMLPQRGIFFADGIVSFTPTRPGPTGPSSPVGAPGLDRDSPRRPRPPIDGPQRHS